MRLTRYSVYKSQYIFVALQCSPTAVEMHGFCGFAGHDFIIFVSECPNLRSSCFLRVGGPVFGHSTGPDGKSTERGKVLTIGVIIPRIHVIPGGGVFSSLL